MIQSGERTVDRPVFDRIAGLARLKFTLIADEVRLGSTHLALFGLISIAIGLQTLAVLTPGHFRPADLGLFSAMVVAATLLSLGATLLATLPLRRANSPMRRWTAATGLATLVALAVLSALIVLPHAFSLGRTTPYGNDGAIMDLYAAQQVVSGHNPYHDANLVTALANLDAPSTTTTPLMDGQFRAARAYPSEAAVAKVFASVQRLRPRTIPPEFESKYNYPAGAFLLIVPFVWAGIYDLKFLYLLAIVAMGAYVWWRMPRSMRFLVPLLVISDVPLTLNILGGQPDPIYALFLMLGLAEWRRRKISALSLGLAMAIKQLAWFSAPFYLFWIWYRLGWREALGRAGVIATFFLALNGPFILQSPASYVSSLAAPMSDPMFPLGMGVISLFVSNVLPMVPKAVFSAAEISVWVGGLAVAIYFRRSLVMASGIVLATIPLFFAWRSLDNYFYLVPLMALAIMLGGGSKLEESAEAR